MMGFNIPVSPEDRASRDRVQRMMELQATMNPPQNIGQGIAAVGNAIMMRNTQQQSQFPAVPAPANPATKVSPFQGIKNMFGLGGGAY